MRRRYDRFVRVRLECGHLVDLNTSRYRVSRDLAAIIYGAACRGGTWCMTCRSKGMPVEMVGVVRGGA